MAYTDQSTRPNAAGLTAAVAIQAGIVTALIVGLSVTGTIEERPGFLPSFELDETPPPPPPPEPKPEPDVVPRDVPPASPPITAVPPRLDLNPAPPDVSARDIVLPRADPSLVAEPRVRPTPVPSFTPRPTPAPTPKPTLTFDPVPARPRNNPAEWVTTNDYRSAWIRRGLTGTANFRLDIAANGRVSNCSITRSSGHSVLDEATCTLIQKRARFEPARDTSGDAVAGSYASAIRWDLPE